VHRRHLVAKVVGVAVVVATLGGGAAFAFTAHNTVDTSYAGQGNGAVDGYTVSNISYGLTPIPANAPGDPQDAISSVSFNLTPDNATSAAVDIWGYSNENGTGTDGTLIGGGGGSNCTETAGLWTCQVTGLGNDYTSGPYPTPSNITSIDVQASS
jgi:hypothetical protein